MSATSDHPASGAVAAILSVTPIHPTRGDVITEWVYDDKHPLNALGYTVVHPWRPVQGDPTPIAERQAAAARPAVLRELADELEAREAPAEGKIWLIDAQWLRNRADEIEEAHRGVQA